MTIKGANVTETHQERSEKGAFGDEKDKGEEKTEPREGYDEQKSPRAVLDARITSPSSSYHSSSSSSTSGSAGNSTTFSSPGSDSSSPPLSGEKSISPQKGGGGGGMFGDNHALLWKNLVDQVKKRSVIKFSTRPFLGGYEFSKKNLRRRLGRNRSAEEAVECGAFVMPKPSWRNFTYQELAAATDNWSPDKLVGQGGHAEVYRGVLPNGQIVAVKKITKTDKNDEDRVADFLSELGIIAHINHPNAAKLIGFSIDSGLHLVLQFLPHGSLATVLHGPGDSMGWETRYKVAVGVADGLKYLHYECPRRVIHRDITASNILLTEDYEAQISDFGLAKWLPEKWVHHVVSPIEGTFGYMAPEYFMHGIVHEKIDVFAFGVLLLELITGRRAVDSSRQSLVMWAKPFLDQKNARELADPRLGDNYNAVEMKRAMATASACLHHLPNMRPTMKKVVEFLKGEHEPVDIRTKSLGGRALLVDACDLEDYTSTTYLNDLNRHMQLVME